MQIGGAADRAPGQVEELQAAGVPADMISVSELILQEWVLLTGQLKSVMMRHLFWAGCLALRNRHACWRRVLRCQPPRATLNLPTPQSPRKVIAPTFFSDRIPGVTPAQSRELVAALRSAGALDPDGYMLPGGWTGVVAPGIKWLSDGWTFAAVDQEMQVARGDHQNLGGCRLRAPANMPVLCWTDAVRRRGASGAAASGRLLHPIQCMVRSIGKEGRRQHRACLLALHCAVRCWCSEPH